MKKSILMLTAAALFAGPPASATDDYVVLVNKVAARSTGNTTSTVHDAYAVCYPYGGTADHWVHLPNVNDYRKCATGLKIHLYGIQNADGTWPSKIVEYLSSACPTAGEYYHLQILGYDSISGSCQPTSSGDNYDF